jgi:hypothetical protein
MKVDKVGKTKNLNKTKKTAVRSVRGKEREEEDW